MYTDSSGQTIPLGKELGKGGAAHVYFHGNDKSVAVKIFKPDFLLKEKTLEKRIQQLNKLSKLAALSVHYDNEPKPIGSWPQDIVQDRNGRTVGFTMDTVHNGIDLTNIIYSSTNKFYKYRNKSSHALWMNTFFYHPDGIKNRFILCYYLSLFFDRIYQLKAKNGSPIDLEVCNFDIKPNNILVSIDKVGGSNQIIPYILDLDNLTLKNKTGILAPTHPQITPEYKAPEGPIDKYYDYYSISVIFYQLLFNIHPFMSVQGGTRFTDGTTFDFFSKNKCFPWGRNRKFLSRSTHDNINHSNFKFISSDLQALFLRAFDGDAPSLRPAMHEWSKAFLTFLSDRSIKFNQIFVF